MTVTNAAEAIAVLNAAQHRGIRTWAHDRASGRIMPAAWAFQSSGEPAPMLTTFEAMAIARELVAIGAYRPAAQRLDLATI